MNKIEEIRLLNEEEIPACKYCRIREGGWIIQPLLLKFETGGHHSKEQIKQMERESNCESHEENKEGRCIKCDKYMHSIGYFGFEQRWRCPKCYRLYQVGWETMDKGDD